MTTTFPLPLLENRTHSLRWIKQGPSLVHGSGLLRSNLCSKTGMLRSFIDEVRIELRSSRKEEKHRKRCWTVPKWEVA